MFGWGVDLDDVWINDYKVNFLVINYGMPKSFSLTCEKFRFFDGSKGFASASSSRYTTEILALSLLWVKFLLSKRGHSFKNESHLSINLILWHLILFYVICFFLEPSTHSSSIAKGIGDSSTTDSGHVPLYYWLSGKVTGYFPTDR